MSFFVATDGYERFMGRFSRPLGPLLADFAGVGAGDRVVDVGCGTGALTDELVRRVGPSSVVALDPSEPFVGAARQRNPDVEIHVAPAEEIPCGDGEFDAALAQLVVHFMADPVRGLGEMARVTREEGVVAASVWDYAGGSSPLSLAWSVITELDPDAETESGLAGARQGDLSALFARAGLRDVEETGLTVHVDYVEFDEWWQPYLLGVGPIGAYLGRLDDAARARVRDGCRRKLGDGPFTVSGTAWAARGSV